MLVIGSHVNYVSGMYEHIINHVQSIKSSTNINIKVIALFVVNPRSYKDLLTEEDKQKLAILPIKIIVHNTYLAVPWKNSAKALGFIKYQLRICDEINASGFVIHLPKNDIDAVINIIPKLYFPDIRTRIYFEIPSISPKSSIFHDTNILNKLFIAIKLIDNTMKHFGLCIDTAHLWSCGVDLSSYDLANKWIYQLEIDPECIMIHFNDNNKELGIAPDEHSVLTHGKIWKRFKNNLLNSGIYSFIQYAMKYDVPIILERKDMKLLINDYVIIQQLI